MTGNNAPSETRIGFGMAPPGRDAAGRGTPADDPESAEPEGLPPDAQVDLGKERAATGIDEVFEALDTDLVGLTPVKTRIREIAALLLVDRARSRFGRAATRPNRARCASTSSSAAISRIRVLTGASPTSSRSSASRTASTPEC